MSTTKTNGTHGAYLLRFAASMRGINHAESDDMQEAGEALLKADERVRELEKAARGVIKNWERGDLSLAVRKLDGVLRDE